MKSGVNRVLVGAAVLPMLVSAGAALAADESKPAAKPAAAPAKAAPHKVTIHKKHTAMRKASKPAAKASTTKPAEKK